MLIYHKCAPKCNNRINKFEVYLNMEILKISHTHSNCFWKKFGSLCIIGLFLQQMGANKNCIYLYISNNKEYTQLLSDLLIKLLRNARLTRLCWYLLLCHKHLRHRSHQCPVGHCYLYWGSCHKRPLHYLYPQYCPGWG